MTDVKALIERLRDMGDHMNRHNYSIGHYWNVVDEAADALEAMERMIRARDGAIERHMKTNDELKAELAEERRKREEAEKNFADARVIAFGPHLKCASQQEWKAKFEAARESAIKIRSLCLLYHRGEDSLKSVAEAREQVVAEVDTEIAAKLKEATK